jgi:glutathione S-transferase
MAINPRGYVPALVLDDGATLSEAVAILAYIADQAPGNAFPEVRQGMGRYDMLSWLAFISSELHKNFGAFFNPAAGSDWKDAATASLKARLGYLDRHLDGRNYLMGEAFGPPDAYLFVVLSWARYVRLDLTDWKNVTAYLSRVGARPGVQQALKAEGLA